MAGLGGVGGAAPVLYMAVRARDETKDTFDRVGKKASKLSATMMTTARRVGALAMRFATLGRITGLLSDEQARFIGIIGTVISVATMMSEVVKVATAVDWAHVTALIWKHSLLTLGIGVAIAAAAALAILATATQSAATAQRNYNRELDAGAMAQDRYASRQSGMVRRGEFEEVL